ncbi:hypothetical protein [Bombilactobacillus bombi]|uniref:hypothetical protein n=1 Tax=Bombilactobacillus bombi TaxID=1303590 RepID=UPI00406BC49D
MERRKRTQTFWKKDLFSNTISGLQLVFLYNINQQDVFMGGGGLFPCEVKSMGTWKQSLKGFTVNERLSGTLVDIAVWHIFNCAAQLYRQPQKIKKLPVLTLVGYRVA